jgi:AhpD family alkylhydroperoxidase
MDFSQSSFGFVNEMLCLAIRLSLDSRLVVQYYTIFASPQLLRPETRRSRHRHPGQGRAHFAAGRHLAACSKILPQNFRAMSHRGRVSRHVVVKGNWSTTITTRLNPYANFNLVKSLIDYGQAVQARLDPTLRELIKIRSSQINGCAVCLDMHIREARKLGETEERIYMLDAWRECDLFTARERAALAWTESLTRLSETRAPDDVYGMVAAEFSPEEQVNISLMIGVINAFNKLGVGFRLGPIKAAPGKAAA